NVKLDACFSGSPANCAAGGWDFSFVCAASGTNEQTFDLTSCTLTSTTVQFTNYVHCLSWTNNTGSWQPGSLYDTNGLFYGAVAIGQGNVFSVCITNQSNADIDLYARQYLGQPQGDWPNVTAATSTTSVGSVGASQGTSGLVN